MKEKTADIDILEEMIKPIATRTFIFPDGRKEEKEIYNLERKQIEAIENLIAENKELKEKIKEIEEEDVKIRAKFLLQLDNYILKSKVREFIREKMKYLMVDSSGVDEGRYEAYMCVLDLLGKE